MGRFFAQGRLLMAQPGFLGLLGGAFALGLAYSFVSPFLSLWGIEEVGMRSFVFGLFMTATSLSAIVVGTTLARWSDTHLPRKLMLLVGGVGGMLGYTGYALVRDPIALLCIGCTVLALGAVCFSQLFAHVRERFETGDIEGLPPGLAMSVVRVCFSLAWTAGPSIGAMVKVHLGFQGLFLAAAALFLIFAAGVWKFVPYEPRSAQARTAIRQPVWRVLTRRDVCAAFAAFLLIFAAHAMNTMNLPLMLTNVLGGTGRDLGITYGIGPVVEIPLMLWFGHLAARGHQLRLIRIGAALTVIYFLILSVTQAPWQIFPAQVLHGMSFAIISNVAIMFFQDLVPGQPGLATTIFTNAANVGNLVGYFSFGTLVSALGHRGVFLVSASFTMLTLVIVVAYRPHAR